MLSACGSSSKGVALAPADFAVSDDNTPVMVINPSEAAGTSLPVRTVNLSDIRGPVDMSDGILDVTAVAGSPTPAPARPPVPMVRSATTTSAGTPPTEAAGPRVAPPAAAPDYMQIGTLVDAKIGDINGKPIYANAFLAPMADRLRAEAKLMNYAAWKAAASKRITEEVQLVVERELLRAEALASFSPEQKQGFFAWMESVQQKIQSSRGGSREAADAMIQETEGKSLDEYLRQREQNELATFQFTEKISRRVNVSKRDVEVEYQRMYDIFNPPPKVKFRLVQIPSDKPEEIAEFTRLVASGTPFADLAILPINRYKVETGGLEVRDIKGPREEASLFGNEALNKAAQTLQPGETVGPIALSASAAWLNLEEIETRSRSLYEAQIPLENMLREQRTRVAKDKYIAQLIARASMTSVDEMSARLLQIAEGRFYPDKNYQPPVKARR